MDAVQIIGGSPLRGEVEVSGAKNACLPIFAATLLTDEPCIIENVPDLSDVRFMLEILEHLGAEVTQLSPSSWKVVAKNITHKAPYHLVRQMRASVCLMGPLLGRLRQAVVSLPGGCVIGQRPIDIHLKGFAKLGTSVNIENGYVYLDALNTLKGADIFLGGRQGSTVTGTENIIMAAVLAPGITRIDSAACEPEVEDLCRMLVAMGADIEGIGSHNLTIKGVEKLHGCQYSVCGDRIEAGSFIIAGLMGYNDITVKGMDVRHLRSLLHKLEEAEADIEVIDNNTVRAKSSTRPLKPIEIVTLPYPGFPTDLQAQMIALMALTPGISIVTERIYPNRFMHVPELLRMGADISIEGSSAIINGVNSLSGAPIMASDLRASAALFLAGLVAKGETWIQRIYHLDRGYENFDEKLRKLGAKITRVSDKDMPAHVA